jgi:uncharacterized protein with HEPN domain
MNKDAERLEDILEAIAKIEEQTRDGRERFFSQELVQVWVVYHLQVIGEACRKFSEEFRNRNSQIPWAQIIAMRNIMIHDYLHIDLKEVWAAVEKDLPALKKQMQAIDASGGV